MSIQTLKEKNPGGMPIQTNSLMHARRGVVKIERCHIPSPPQRQYLSNLRVKHKHAFMTLTIRAAGERGERMHA
jgi:hypothetical protein